jgi:hypothetical protein
MTPPVHLTSHKEVAMSSSSGFPLSGQRPQLISRFELPQIQQVGKVGQAAEPEQTVGTSVQGPSTQVAQRIFEAQRLNFPTENAIGRFRGDVSGRGVGAVSGGQAISRLPKQVQPFDPSAPSGVISSLNPAERAAIGAPAQGQEASRALEEPQLSQGVAERAEGRFPGLEESRFPGAEEAEVTSAEATGAEASDEPAAPGEPTKANGETLSEQELREVEQLQSRDLEVKAHERAHLSAAGQHARGGMRLSYTTGPDGRRYATDGEVGIDISEGSSPEETISKMQSVRRAALAPANPSSADRSVAAAASQREQAARVELADERQVELREQQEELRASGESQREDEGTERAAEVEINEGAESFAGAQAVQPEINSAAKGSGIETRSLDMAQALKAAAAQVEFARAVEAPSPDRSPSPKRAIMRSPEADEAPEPRPEPEESAEAE